MKKQMKIGYNLHWSAYVTETINITSKLLSELNLDKNATDEEIIKAIKYNTEYLNGVMEIGIPIKTKGVNDVDIFQFDVEEIKSI